MRKYRAMVQWGHRGVGNVEHGARPWSRRVVLFVLIMTFQAAAPAAAQYQNLPHADVAEEAISQLRSPFCPGLMLKVCPSLAAAALRDSIYVMAANGSSSDEIVEWMLGRHGEEWRGVPLRSGAGLWAWIIPPLALLLGVGAAIGWIRANRSEPEEDGALASSDLSEADRERISAALREWEESGEGDS